MTAINGLYFIVCSLCGCKKYNIEARLDEEGRWQCKDHKEIMREPKFDRRPLEGLYVPQIINKPQIIFGNAGHDTWEIIAFNWEDLDINWEDL